MEQTAKRLEKLYPSNWLISLYQPKQGLNVLRVSE